MFDTSFTIALIALLGWCSALWITAIDFQGLTDLETSLSRLIATDDDQMLNRSLSVLSHRRVERISGH